MDKIVLYTQRVEIIEFYDERRDCADQRISRLIKYCGFIPVALPNALNIAIELVNELKPVGIILTGGNSLVKYGGNAPERDETEAALIEKGVKEKIPLYGFCRGMQLILDYFGNELEDISGHVAVRHMIKGIEENIEVNSYHNLACRRLKSNQLMAVMWTEDGIIEKIKHRTLPIIGTMWHPEREKPFQDIDANMIKTLFGGTI